MQINRASFRGVPFAITSVTTSEGRRVETYEFINQEIFDYQDLGAKAVKFAVEAFVIGYNWQEKRDNLRAALLKKGEGELILPYLDSPLNVIVQGDFGVSEASSNMARFSINFIIAKKNLEFSQVNIIGVQDKSIELFNKTHNSLQKIIEEIKSVDNKIVNIIAGVFSSINSLFGQVRTLANTHASLDLLKSIYKGVVKKEGDWAVFAGKSDAMIFGLTNTTTTMLATDFIDSDKFDKVKHEFENLYKFCEQEIPSEQYAEVAQIVRETQAVLLETRKSLRVVKQLYVASPTPIMLLANMYDMDFDSLDQLNNIKNPLFYQGLLKYYEVTHDNSKN